jgi:hypothetical protein
MLNASSIGMARETSRWIFLIFGTVGLLLVLWNWSLLLTQHRFYPRTALFGPLSTILIFLALKPKYLGHMESLTPNQRYVVPMAMLGALGLGVVNLLLMRKLA